MSNYASGIAAIYKVCRRQKPKDALRGLDFDPQMVTLSALQHVASSELDLSSLPVNADTTCYDHLRLACLVVGLDRSPQNLLSPRHSDREMVRALGQHHDPIVSQYSIWAVTENPNLGMADLGIPLVDVARKPPNVRSWIYQLFGMSPGDIFNQWDFLQSAIADDDAEARAGLALGIRDVYIDGFEPIILDWLLRREIDPEVSAILTEHIVVHSKRSAIYADTAKQIFAAELPGSLLRQRMEAAAQGTDLRQPFRVMEIDFMADLFREGSNVTNNNTLNIYGSVQGGALSQTGSASNSGTTTIQHYSRETISKVHTELAHSEQAVLSSELDKSDKDDAIEKIAAAEVDPTPDRLHTVVELLDRLGKVTTAGTALLPVAESLGRAAGLIA